MGHMYATSGIDVQKCIDDARKRLERDSEETIIHYHKYEDACNPADVHTFISKEVPEVKEDSEADKLKQRLSKAANMLDNYDSDRLPYEYMLEFNDFRTGLKKLLLQGVE